MPELSPAQIYQLQNKAPCIADTLRQVADYHDNIDEWTDDEDWPDHPKFKAVLDKEEDTTSSGKKRLFGDCSDEEESLLGRCYYSYD